ncbi:MAG: SurA N-terminal domain-containing protein [Robiginitomaculum sp.]
MSNKTTSSFQKLATGIIIGLLVVGLMIFGLSDVFTPSNQNAVALVGKEKVSTLDFDRSFKQRLSAYNRENKTNMTASQAFNRGFARQIVDQMVTTTAVRLDADTLGVGVANKVAAEEIRKAPYFQDEVTGRFSEDKLNQILRANGNMTRRAYEADIVRGLKVDQVVSATIAGIKAPLEYAQQRYQFITEQRKVSVLTLTKDAVTAPAAPSDEVLKAFIDEHEANYIAPEYRAFTMLRIELTDLNPDVVVPEEEIRKMYDRKLQTKKLGTPEMRSVTLINATNEAMAKEAVTQLIAGTDAAQVSAGLGFVEPTVYTAVLEDNITDPAAAKAAFAAKTTGEHHIVEGQLGWFVVTLDDVIAAVAPNYEALHDELETELKSDIAKGTLYDVTGEVEAAMLDGASLEDAGKAAGVSVSSIDYIDRTGLTQEGVRLDGVSVITGVAADEKILMEIFTNEIGYATDIMDSSKGGYFAIRVDQIIESQRRPFGEIKASASAAWINIETEKLLVTLEDGLKDRLREGESLADIKASLPKGALLNDIVMVRSTRSPQLSGSVAARAYSAKTGESVSGFGPAPLTRSVVVVNKIISNADDMAGGFADAMQMQATTELSSDIQQAYRAALLTENEVFIFDDKIKRQLGITD